MRRPTKRHLTPIIEILAFVSGIILSGVASLVFGNVIPWSEAGLVASVLVVTLTGIFVLLHYDARAEEFAETQAEEVRKLRESTIHDVHELAETMKTTVTYVEELYQGAEATYRGAPFLELDRLLAQAEKEILILGGPTIGADENLISNHPSRAWYLKTIEDAIRRQETSGFRYVRLIQTPFDESKGFGKMRMSPVAWEHCRTVLEMERAIATRPFDERGQEERPHIYAKKIPNRRLSSVTIVDQLHLVLEVDTVDENGAAATTGLFFFDDYGGRIVKRFLWYFHNLEENATPVTLSDLEREGPWTAP